MILFILQKESRTKLNSDFLEICPENRLEVKTSDHFNFITMSQKWDERIITIVSIITIVIDMLK